MMHDDALCMGHVEDSLGGFEVCMDDAVAVDILQSQRCLCHIGAGQVHREALIPLKQAFTIATYE